MSHTLDHRRCATDLYLLFYQNLPQHRGRLGRDNVLDTTALARDLEVTPQTLYTWLVRGAFPTSRMMSLVALPGSELTVEKLLPFGAFKN